MLCGPSKRMAMINGCSSPTVVKSTHRIWSALFLEWDTPTPFSCQRSIRSVCFGPLFLWFWKSLSSAHIALAHQRDGCGASSVGKYACCFCVGNVIFICL